MERPNAPPTAVDLLLGAGASAVGLVRLTARATIRTITTVYPPAGRLAAAAVE